MRELWKNRKKIPNLFIGYLQKTVKLCIMILYEILLERWSNYEAFRR